MNEQNLHAPCKVCGAQTIESFRATLLKKYEVAYFHCDACGLLATEPPYWLDEAYSDAISVLDTGLVNRNIEISEKLATLLYFVFGPKATYLDAAGGYGMLVRLMRDIGFNFYWDDKYCRNLMARGFESDQASDPFRAVTAFEVLEHLQDPLEWLKDTFDTYKTRTLIFTTEVYYGKLPPRDWWYYAREGGQHIAFYQPKTLRQIAKRLNLHYQFAQGFHIFSDTPLHRLSWYIKFSRYFHPQMLAHVRRRLTPKTMDDHIAMKNFGEVITQTTVRQR